MGRGLGQNLITVQRRTYLIGPESVGQAERVGGWFVVGRRHSLHLGRMIEDYTELAAIGFEIILTEIESGETRNMSDVDIDGHEGSVEPGRYPLINMTSITRILLGGTAALLVAAGIAAMVLGHDQITGGVLLRTGILLGAAWLVAPLWARPAPATIVTLGAIALVVARPRLIFAVVIAALIWRFSPRRSSL